MRDGAAAHAAHRRVIGRDDEQRALDDALAQARAGSAPAVALVGEPGIGKTTLLRRTCEAAAADGFQVFAGRGSEFEREVPFAMVVDGLDQPLASLEPVLLRRIGDELLAELGAVLPALSGVGGGLGSALESERYRAHYAIRAVLEQLARERPLILALDDVHWADLASLETVSYLVRHPIPGSVLALAYRPYQAPRQLAAALELALQDGDLTALALTPLSLDQAGQLVGHALDAATVRAVHAETGGNPFYLEQLARTAHLASAQRSSPAAIVHAASPASVRAAIVREIDRASPQARALLDAAAVEGEGFELDLAAEIAELDRPAALAALDELVELDLLRETAVPGRFVFRHPIVRRAIYDAASPGRRMLAHERTARALTRRGAAIGRVAHHVERAAQPGDEEAIRLLTAAGEAAAPRAPASAARWYEAALRLLPVNAAAEQRLALLEPLATALATLGRMRESAEVLTQALDVVPARSPAHARITAMIARAEVGLGHGADARRLLLMALDAAAPETAEAVELKLELAASHVMEGEWEAGQRASAQARRLARSLDDPSSTLVATAHSALYAGYGGVFDDAVRWADEAAAGIDVLQDGDLTPQLLEAVMNLAYAEAAIDRLAAADRHLERGLRVGRAAGYGYIFLGLTFGQSMMWLLQGRLDDARRAAEAGSEAARLLENDQWLAATEGTRCWVASLQGDLSATLAAGRDALSAASRAPDSQYTWHARVCYAEALIDAGQHEHGIQKIRAMGGVDLSEVPPGLRPHWLRVLAEAELAAGRVDVAEAAMRRLVADAESRSIPSRLAAARYVRASVLLARGEAREAARCAREAAAAYETAGYRIEAARARLLIGQALTATGDLAAAGTELGATLATLRDCGAARLVDRAARQLRELGVHAPRGEAGRREGVDGPSALSQREREIAVRINEGLTNRQIAEQLFLSQKTIERHVTHIFAKLGVSSRAAVAAAIERWRAGSD